MPVPKHTEMGAERLQVANRLGFPTPASQPASQQQQSDAEETKRRFVAEGMMEGKAQVDNYGRQPNKPVRGLDLSSW